MQSQAALCFRYLISIQSLQQLQAPLTFSANKNQSTNQTPHQQNETNSSQRAKQNIESNKETRRSKTTQSLISSPRLATTHSNTQTDTYPSAGAVAFVVASAAIRSRSECLIDDSSMLPLELLARLTSLPDLPSLPFVLLLSRTLSALRACRPAAVFSTEAKV